VPVVDPAVEGEPPLAAESVDPVPPSPGVVASEPEGVVTPASVSVAPDEEPLDGAAVSLEPLPAVPSAPEPAELPVSELAVPLPVPEPAPLPLPAEGSTPGPAAPGSGEPLEPVDPVEPPDPLSVEEDPLPVDPAVPPGAVAPELVPEGLLVPVPSPSVAEVAPE
jgi:hypothetical protein